MAGKNPVSHVGKLYNLAAAHIAGAVARNIPGMLAANSMKIY
ncbi:MAG TPA: methionine adenosyltransferase [Bryobacteraceae bacterium]|nr:methionine adenosyltransferase [Bryobacteraceae bacterium]